MKEKWCSERRKCSVFEQIGEKSRERKVEEIDFEVDRSGLIDIAVCRKQDLEIETQTFMDVVYFPLLSG